MGLHRPHLVWSQFTGEVAEPREERGMLDTIEMDVGSCQPRSPPTCSWACSETPQHHCSRHPATPVPHGQKQSEPMGRALRFGDFSMPELGGDSHALPACA